MAVTSFMYALSRQEVIEALKHRVTQIDAKIVSNNYNVDDVRRSPSTPSYVREIFELATGRLRGEQQWARELLERLRAGDYSFAGETDAVDAVSPSYKRSERFATKRSSESMDSSGA
jgi:hypothetical protein